MKGLSPHTLIYEFRARGIVRKADKATKGRAEKLSSELVLVKGNHLTFKTESGTTPGKFWVQKVQLLDFAKALKPYWAGRSKNLVVAVTKAVKGQVKVSCNCPAMRYWGFAYIASQSNYKVGRAQTRFPQVRNPLLRGSVCKHLVNVLKALPFNITKIVRAARKSGSV